MKYINMNEDLKEVRKILLLGMILQLQFFELSMEKKVKMEMVFNIYLKILQFTLVQIIRLLMDIQLIQNIKV